MSHVEPQSDTAAELLGGRVRILTYPWPFLYSVDAEGIVRNVERQAVAAEPPTPRKKKPAPAATSASTSITARCISGTRY